MTLAPEVTASLIAAFAVLAGGYLGGWLNRKQATETARTVATLERERYAHDRLWDARREIYTDLVAKMRVFKVAADVVADGFTDGEMHPEEYFQAGGYDEDNDASINAYRSLAQAYNDTRLLISDAISARFEQFLAEIAVADDDGDPPNRAIDAARAASSAHEALLAIALSEIAPKK